ncbi:MAG: hypothetical protein AAGA55_08475 [Planctomycetota bacterium]
MRSEFRCPTCRYDLSAIAEAVDGGVRGETELVCPECGRATTALAAVSAPGGDRGWGYFLLWLVAAFGTLSLLGCCGSLVGYVLLNAFGGNP